MQKSSLINTEKEPKFSLKIYDYVSLLLIMFMLSGSTSKSYLYIGMLIFVMWVFLSYINDKKVFNKSFGDKKISLLILFLLYNICTGLPIGGISYTLKQIGAWLLLFSPMFMFVYYKNINDYKRLKLMWVCSIGIYIFWSVKAILFYNGEENAARILASEQQYYGDIAIGGGYGLAYGASLLSILILELYLSYRKPKFIISFVIFSILSVVVIQTKSTITLLCWIVGLFVCIVYTKRINSRQYKILFKLILGLSFIAVLLFFIFNRDSIGLYIINYTTGKTDAISIRLNSIGNALYSGFNSQSALYLLDRMSRPLWSLEVALNNPVFGVGWKYGNGFKSFVGLGLGRHCEWFDILADNGLIFGFVLIAVYVINFKELFQNKNIKFSKALVVCLILLGVFNPFRTYQSLFVTFFIIPATFYRLDIFKKDIKKGDFCDKNTLKNQKSITS